jgi:hypothetical protein
MAMKQYSKKGGATKSYKKKTFKKTFKKAPAASMSKKLKTIIAGEVQKALSSGAQNERRKVTMELVLPDNQVHINGKRSMFNCIRLPITDAIPAMSGSGQVADVRRRQSNKVMVTGVNVRAAFSVSDETRVVVFPYEPHESMKPYLKKTPLQLEPSALDGHVPEKFATVMQSHYALGMVSKHGPLMTKKAGEDIALDSVDGSVYECRVSTHAGKPMGTVKRMKCGGGGLRRTLNWDQHGKQEVIGKGYTAWSTHTLNEYWKLNKPYTYMHEVVNEQVFERSAEMFMYVDCPSLESKEIAENQPLVGAVIRSVVVDIYYHDL